MPVWGRAAYTKSAIIRNPPVLPIPMYYGSISWSVSFQGFTSATLDYENIAESDLQKFESQYNHRLGGQSRNIEVSFYGLDFKVDSYSYDRQKTIYRDAIKINIYTVSIGLKSKWEDKINTDVKVFKIVPVGSRSVTIGEIANYLNIPYSGVRISLPIPSNADKDYTINLQSAVTEYAVIKGCYVSFSKGISLLDVSSGGKSWNFSDYEIINDGRNTLQASVGYKETELSWNSGTNADETTDPSSSPISFTLEEPVQEEFEEYDEDYEKPPAGTEVLWDLSSTHDISGPKKTRRKVVNLNGNPSSEETWIYSFEYTAEDIATEDGQLFTDEPSNFWKLIEYQKTDYIYRTIPGLTLNIQAKDQNIAFANTSLSGYINLIVHPDYEQFGFANISGGQGTFSGTCEYLVEVITKGWKRFRFEKETNDNLISLYSDDPRYPYVQYKKLPTEAGTAYDLVTARTIYGGDINNNLPFSVEWKTYSELEDRLKEKIDSNSQISSNGKVGVIYPDANYVEPMSVQTETRYSSSFAYTPNPESSADDPKPPYMTGEETYYRVDRKKISNSKYSEKNSEFSSQNSGFSDTVEKVTYKEISGKFPEATTRKREWKKTDGNTNSTNNSDNKQYRYFMNSDNNQYIQAGNSKSYDGAKTQEEAKKAALTELIIEGANKDQSQQSLFSFYPNLADGDRVVLEVDRFRGIGDWRVISASWNLEFRGVADKYGLRPICQAQPTSLTLGLFQNRNIQIEKKEAPLDANSSSSNTADPKLVVSGGQTQYLGKIISKSPNRRRFNVQDN